jgi:hypothetical protein
MAPAKPGFRKNETWARFNYPLSNSVPLVPVKQIEPIYLILHASLSEGRAATLMLNVGIYPIWHPATEGRDWAGFLVGVAGFEPATLHPERSACFLNYCSYRERTGFHHVLFTPESHLGRTL